MKTLQLPRLVSAVFTIALATLTLTSVGVAHAQDNLRGAPYNGYTGVTFDTTKYAYDYLVDGSLAQDDPANKTFKSLAAAYEAAPAGTAAKPTVIGIKPNLYLFHAEPGASASMTITKNYITLLGLTNDRRNVVIADNRGNKEGATNNGYVLDVNATGFSAINLTVVNFANMDYEYPGDASKNLKMRSPVITQAVAMNLRGDKHYYSHVAFLSRLDTMFIQTTRSYFTNAYVEGTDDFLGGGQVSVFQDSEIYFPTGNGVMSASGITFINTVFRAERGLEFHKGFRNPDTLINCTMPTITPTTKVAWMVWKTPVRQNVYAMTYKTKDPKGNPVRIMDSIVGPPTYTLGRELSDEEVKAFNPWNLLRATPNGVADDWDPAGVKDKYASVGSEVFRMELTGGRSAGDDGSGPFTSPTVSPTVRTRGPGSKINANVSPARVKNAVITWSASSPLVSLSATTGNSIVVTANNTTGKPEWVPVKASAPNGFYVTAYIYAEPKYIDPPEFSSKPSVAAPANGKVQVNYALNLAGHDDQSLISWYLCDSAACDGARKIAVSRGYEPLKSITLTTGDVGKYVKVSIAPKHNISDPGPEVAAVSSKPIVAADVKSTTVNPNFRNFVETTNDSFVNGQWTVIGTWTSQSAEELVNGYGLRVSNPPAAAGGAGGGLGAGGSGPTAGRPPNPHAALVM